MLLSLKCSTASVGNDNPILSAASIELPGLIGRITPSRALPSEDHARKLLDIGKLAEDTVRPGAEITREQLVDVINQYERFLSDNPDSVYAPSLHETLGSHYRSLGRTSQAIEHWRKVLAALDQEKQGVGKDIADAALVRLANTLTTIGRVDELNDFAVRYADRPLDGGVLSMLWRNAMESRAMMRRHPEISFKCGVFALAHVARELKGGWEPGIATLTSPRTGFSLRSLELIAAQKGLRLKAALRLEGEELVTPAVVHWRQNHYAALIKKEELNVKVIDPTSQIHTWMHADDVTVEASGAFLIPEDRLPIGWRWMKPEESEKVFGMGFPTTSDPGPDCGGTGGGDSGDGGADDAGCTACNPDKGDMQIAGAGNLDFLKNGTPPGQNPNPTFGPKLSSGMPHWSVSEPWINLWLFDRPYSYKSKYGPDVDLLVVYKQRQSSFAGSPGGYSRFQQGNTGGFLWRSPWFSQIMPNPYSSGNIVRFGTDNTETHIYDYYHTSHVTTEFYPPDWETGYGLQDTGRQGFLGITALETGGVHTGWKIRLPDGSMEMYTNRVADRHFALSGLITPTGDQTKFVMTYSLYTNNLGQVSQINHRTSQVIAADGGTINLYYDDSNYPYTVTRIVGPSGETVTFTYDDNHDFGTLATIRDAAGLLSRINYDTSGVPSSLVTPYGTTSFQIVDNTGADWHDDSAQIDRSIVVTEPDGGKKIYALINIDGVGNVPNSTPTVPTITGESTWLGTLDTTGANQRNSFYWSRQASALLSTTSLNSLTTQDFKYARTRHWLNWTGATTEPALVGNILSWVREGSPDGSSYGPSTWYDYSGKELDGSGQVMKSTLGTNNLPSVIAKVMPDGTVWYTAYKWSPWQQPLSITERAVLGGSATFRNQSFTYVDNFYTATHTNALGDLAARYGYDGAHRVIAFTNAVNDVTEFKYDSLGRLNYQKSPGGLATTNYFSGDHLTRWSVSLTNSVAWRTSSVQRIDGQTYTRSGLNGTTLTNVTRLFVATDHRGLAVTNVLDELGRLIERRYPEATANKEKWLYELFPSQSYSGSTGGKLILDKTAYVDRLGYTNTYTYDNLRRLAYHEDGRTNSPTTTYYQYCDCGSPTFMTVGYLSGIAESTTFTYDLLGRQLTKIPPGGKGSLTNQYDIVGRRWNVQDALTSTTNVFDNFGRLAEVRNGQGLVHKAVFDALNRTVQITDRNGVTATNVFDSIGRLTSRTTPDVGAGNEIETFVYSAVGLLRQTNQLGATTWHVYDATERKIATTNANLEVVKFSYNAANDLVTLTDGKANVTTWGYDSYGRVLSKQYANGVTNLTYTYDANGRLTSRWSQGKGTTVYSYDSVGNLTKVDYPSSTDVTLAYDALNRLTTMVDAAGTNQFTFSDGLLTSEITPWNTNAVGYSYNSARLRSGLSLYQTGGGVLTNGYRYDSGKRLTNVTSQAGSFDYYYANFGAYPGNRVQKQTIPASSGSIYITNTFDASARMLSTALMSSITGTVQSITYGLNNANQRTTITRDTRENVNYDYFTTYRYDAVGQLVSANATNLTGGAVQTLEQMGYLYDGSWNLGQRTNNGTMTVFTNNILNQIVKVGTTSLSHDTNGNLTLDNSGWSYTYDDENRLASVYLQGAGNGDKSEFTYDGLSRLRIRKDYTWDGVNWNLSGETRYFYDGMRVIQERNSSNVPTVTYTRGNDLSGSLQGAGGIGGLLARSAHSGSSPYAISSSAFYHADGNGNVVYMINSDHSLAAEYRYDPYGKTIASAGSLKDSNKYRFSSKEFIVNGGVYYFGYRFYSPTIQRWLNRDPVGDTAFDIVRLASITRSFRESLKDVETINLYCFVQNSPQEKYDALGLKSKGIFSIIGGILTGCGKAPVRSWTPPSGPGDCGNDPDYSVSVKDWTLCKSQTGDGAAECATMCSCLAGQTDAIEHLCQEACIMSYKSRCK